MAKQAPTQPDDFDRHLENAMREAREFFARCHAPYAVEEADHGTVISVFGGFWQWHIDRKHRRVYEISKQSPDEPLKCRMGEDFTLFARQRTPIRDKLFRWSQEALEMQLENIGIDEKGTGGEGIVYVRQKDMLKVPFVISAHEMMARQKKVAKAAMTVLNECWGPDTKLAKVFVTVGKSLWDRLDPEICRYALMLAGPKANVLDYNLCWVNLEEVRKIARTTPGILPVWRHIATDKATKTGRFHQPNIVKDVQEHLRTAFGDGNGLTKRGWRWLVRQQPVWVQHLCKLYSPMDTRGGGYDYYRDHDARDFDRRIATLPAALDFLGTVDVKPRFPLFYQTMRGVQRHNRTNELIVMVRAAFRASHKKPAKTFFRQEVSLTMDWIEREPTLRFDQNQSKADWDWFMRRQIEWHREVAHRENMTRENTAWESQVKEFEHNGYHVVPLTTAHELHVEGKTMHHCVGTYSNSCEQGSSRIFSIRNNAGNSLATFEIRREQVPGQKVGRLPPGVNQYDDGAEEKMEFENFQVNWTVAQCRGPCNATVKDLEHLADMTATLYAKACMELEPKDRFFKVMRPHFWAEKVAVPPAEARLADQIEAAGNDDLAAAIREGRVLVEEVGEGDEAFEAARHGNGAVPVNADEDPDVPHAAR